MRFATLVPFVAAPTDCRRPMAVVAGDTHTCAGIETI